MKFGILTSIILFITGCAIQSAPEGGPQDTTPPDIVACTPPNKTTNFNAKEIVIQFDEYVQLKNFSGQFFSSPPLKKRIEQRMKGKKLHLYLDEELLPNTTYTFSFGTAIQDITENNTQANFKYVFSTGDVLDSLAITGTVTDAFTGNVEEGAVAMLYPANLPDSSLLTTKPTFYALTDKSGKFSIENLALDTFKLVVIKDENLNLTYDAATEKSGFCTSTVVAGEPLAKPVRLFHPAKEPALIEAVQKGYGRVLLTFTNPVPPTEVKIMDLFESENLGKPTTDFSERAGKGDSIYFWYNPVFYPEDMRFFFLTLNNDDFSKDSVRVLLSKAKAPELKLALQNLTKLSPLDTFLLESTVPLTNIDPDLFTLLQDTIAVPFTITHTGPRFLRLDFDKKAGRSYELILLPNAVTDLFERTIDSTSIKTSIATDADKAIVKFRIVATDTVPKLFELLRGAKTIKRIAFTDSVVLDIPFIEPGKYGIRIVWDENQNGRWDGGNYLQRKQPEEVMYYPKPIELRANWELEVEWEIPEP